MDVYGIKDFPDTGLKGSIKQNPEDFMVEEVTPSGKVCRIGFDLSFIRDRIPKDMKEHLHFTLVKRNYTTQRAVSTISKRLRIGHKRFGYAGTKDRNAMTAQRISVWNQKIDALKKIKARDIRIKDFSYEPERLNLGNLKSNRFKIKVSGIEGSADALKKFNPKKVLNYFGPQRFGEQRHINHLVGKQLLLGNFEGALMILLTNPGDENEKAAGARKFASENWGKWREILKVWPRHLGIEAAIMNYLVTYPTDYANAFRKLPKKLRRMFIHAFQSYVFNVLLTKLDEQNQEIPEILPLIGYDSKLEGRTGEIIRGVLKDELISLDTFRLPRMPELSEPGSFRETCMEVSGFRYSISKNSLTLKFTLGKGSYATVLLKNFLVLS